MPNRAQKILLILLLIGIGYWLWAEQGKSASASSGDPAATLPSVQANDRFTIVEKIKPGGYIGWHQTEQDRMTASPRQTRQTSYYYFICRDQSGARRIFQVSERTFNAERVGNVLTGRDMGGLREVHAIEEPALPSEFQFRRREGTSPTR